MNAFARSGQLCTSPPLLRGYFEVFNSADFELQQIVDSFRSGNGWGINIYRNIIIKKLK